LIWSRHVYLVPAGARRPPICSRRQAVLRRIRRDIQMQGWLRIWLYGHVPLTFAALVGLIVHILTTFLYW